MELFKKYKAKIIIPSIIILSPLIAIVLTKIINFTLNSGRIFGTSLRLIYEILHKFS